MAAKLSAKLIKQNEQKLQHEVEKIKHQIAKLKDDDPFADPDYASDNAAIDTDVREQDYHAIIEAQIKDLTKRLSNMKSALERMAKGRYGYCLRCGNSIPVARLELIPEAQYDINCENLLRK